MSIPLRIDIYRSVLGRQPWRWRMRGGNGRIIATGHEGFRTRRGARRAVTNLLARLEQGGTDLRILD